MCWLCMLRTYEGWSDNVLELSCKFVGYSLSFTDVVLSGMAQRKDC